MIVTISCFVLMLLCILFSFPFFFFFFFFFLFVAQNGKIEWCEFPKYMSPNVSGLMLFNVSLLTLISQAFSCTKLAKSLLNDSSNFRNYCTQSPARFCRKKDVRSICIKAPHIFSVEAISPLT